MNTPTRVKPCTVQVRHNGAVSPPGSAARFGHSARKWREIRAKFSHPPEVGFSSQFRSDWTSTGRLLANVCHLLSAAPKSELLVPPVLVILFVTVTLAVAAIGG